MFTSILGVLKRKESGSLGTSLSLKEMFNSQCFLHHMLLRKSNKDLMKTTRDESKKSDALTTTGRDELSMREFMK